MKLEEMQAELSKQASDLATRAQRAEGREKLDLLTRAESRAKYAEALAALVRKTTGEAA